MKFIKIQFNSIKKKTSINIVSILALLAIDFFIASLIFQGLSEQIQQLTQPHEYFPYVYKEMLIQDKWVENNFVYNIALTITKDRYYTKSTKKVTMHDQCQVLEQKFNDIRSDKNLYSDLRTYNRLITQFGGFDNYQKRRGFADSSYNQIQASAKEIRKHPLVIDLIDSIKQIRKTNFQKDISRFNRLFALKRTLFGFAFLIPLIFMLSLWNRKAIQKDWELAIVLSSHFIVLAMLPIVFEVTRLFLEILPNVLLRSIYDFLISSKMVAIWYYLLIFGAIVLSGGLFWFLQNKVFTQKRFLTNRIINSRCTQCSIKVDYEKNFCPNCKNELRIKCPSCSESRIKDMDFCHNCGDE